jgi:hypothetical protein
MVTRRDRKAISDYLDAIEHRDRARAGELREEFVGAALDYAESNGISYETWREVGVDDATLRAAGILPGERAARHGCRCGPR